MIKSHLPALGVLLPLLGGCASQVSVPVNGMLANGSVMNGQATAKMTGEGTFWVTTVEGFKCQGSYDAFDRSPTLIVPIVCSNGKKGQLVITRKTQLSGTAVGKAGDIEGRFTYGDLNYSQVFGTWPEKPSGSQRVIIIPVPQSGPDDQGAGKKRSPRSPDSGLDI